MKFVLFVEGETEARTLPGFLSRWLNSRLRGNVGIKVVRFQGWADYRSEIAKKVRLQLSGKDGKDLIAAIGLLDLYGPTFYPPSMKTAEERKAWAKDHFEGLVDDPRFSQHFAIHEIEAWLLADPYIFPSAIQAAFPTKINRPETVNFDQPPGKLLERLYREKLEGRRYRKIIDGSNLFGKLDPNIAYEKCPGLKALLDDMLSRAHHKGR